MSKAYEIEIKPNGDTTHQSNPAWVVSVVRWIERGRGGTAEQLESRKKQDPYKTADVLVIDTDCTAITVTNSKSSQTPAAQITLKMGKYNYLTAVAPGDYVFVNMLDSEKDAKEVAKKASEGKQINHIHDGFKGVFKIQSVRKIMNIDPRTGMPSQFCVIQAYGFSELNNTVYFNPHLINRTEQKNTYLYISNLSDNWNSALALYGTKQNNVQYLVAKIFELFVGQGQSSKSKKTGSLEKSPTEHFLVPSKVGSMLGENKATAVKDIYNLIFGKQQYLGGQVKSIQDGVNPVNFGPSGTFGNRVYFPNSGAQDCEGFGFITPASFQRTTAFSLMKSYVNEPINELFTTYRISPDGSVMPTIVMRQMPFSSEEYPDASATKFLSLPRWVVSTSSIFNFNVGREESARVNFVQVFGNLSNLKNPNTALSKQIAAPNYISDKTDIFKNGLRPYIINSDFDAFLGSAGQSAPKWKSLLGDALIGGQLKLNGSVSTFGVVEPVPVGDNLKISNTVFHIESVTHNCSIEPNGTKTFMTTFELSNGIIDRAIKQEAYAEMEFSNMDVFDAFQSIEEFGYPTSESSFGVPIQENINFGINKDPAIPPQMPKKSVKRNNIKKMRGKK